MLVHTLYPQKGVGETSTGVEMYTPWQEIVWWYISHMNVRLPADIFIKEIKERSDYNFLTPWSIYSVNTPRGDDFYTRHTR